MKQYPRKAAENAHLLGAWKQPATSCATPIKARRAWHKARLTRRLGEIVSHDFEKKYGVRESRDAAARMRKSIS